MYTTLDSGEFDSVGDGVSKTRPMGLPVGETLPQNSLGGAQALSKHGITGFRQTPVVYLRVPNAGFRGFELRSGLAATTPSPAVY